MSVPTPDPRVGRPRAGRVSRHTVAEGQPEFFTRHPSTEQERPNMVLEPKNVETGEPRLVQVNESVRNLVRDLGGDNETLALLYAFKCAGLRRTNDEKSFVNALFGLLATSLKPGEDASDVVKVMDEVKNALKKGFDRKVANAVLDAYPEETFAAAVAAQLNYGRPMDHMSVMRTLLNDSSVAMRDTGKTRTIAGHFKVEECEILLVHSKLRATMYSRDTDLVNDENRKFTPATTPTAAVQYSALLGAHKKLDTRRVDLIDPDWRRYLHFMVSQFQIKNRKLQRTLPKFAAALESTIIDGFLVRYPDQNRVLTWLEGYLMERIDNEEESVRELNHLTLLDAIQPNDFLEYVHKTFGPDPKEKLLGALKGLKPPAPIDKLIDVVVRHPELSSNYYIPPEDSPYGDLPAVVAELGLSVYPHAKIPRSVGGRDNLRVLESLERYSQALRGKSKYTHERAWAERGGAFGFKSSTVYKGEKVMDAMLDAYEAWNLPDKSPIPTTFVHVGTTAHNMTDWSKRLHAAKFPIRYFDIKSNATANIGYWDIMVKEFPSLIKGCYKLIFDDTFVKTAGDVNLNVTHSNHNTQNDAVLDALGEMLGSKKNQFQNLETGGWEHGVLVYAKKMFYPVEVNAYDNKDFVDHLFTFGWNAGFSHMRFETEVNRLGNSELYVIWARFPPQKMDDGDKWGRPLVPPVYEADEGVDLDDLDDYNYEIDNADAGLNQAYAYQIACSILRTAGYGVWGIPNRIWDRAGRVERITKDLKLLEYQHPDLRETIDPLVHFLKNIESRVGAAKYQVQKLDDLLFALYGTEEKPANVLNALSNLLGVEVPFLHEQLVSVGDLINIWFTANRFAPHKLFRENLPTKTHESFRRGKPAPKRKARGKEEEVEDEGGDVESLTGKLRSASIEEPPSKKPDFSFRPPAEENPDLTMELSQSETSSTGDKVETHYEIPLSPTM